MKLYNYGEIIIPKVNRQHPKATVVDRPSTFYDKIIANEFREKFKFDYPEVDNEKENKHVLKKKRIR